MRCQECEAGATAQPRYCTCCGRALESAAPLMAEASPLIAHSPGAAVEDAQPGLQFGDAAPFDPATLAETGFAAAQDALPPLRFDDAAPFEPIALLAADTTTAGEDFLSSHASDAGPFEPTALPDADMMPSGVVDAGPSDIAPWFGFAEPDAAPRFEPVALVEANGDDVVRTGDHAAEAVCDGAVAGVPDAPEDAVAAFDEPVAAPAPWWQIPRPVDHGTLAAVSLDQDPASESARPGGFDPLPSPPEAVNPGGVVVDESPASGAVSEPSPRQPESAPADRHGSSYEPPRIPAPVRRPQRQSASASRLSRHAGLALVAAAVLIVAVVVGAPSIVFWPPYAPVDPAIAPPVSEAELAAAVAALESQPLTDPAASTVPTGGAKSPMSSAAAASAATAKAPSSKGPDRNAIAKRRNAARPPAPAAPRVRNEPAAVAPAPLAASSLNVPVQAARAPAAAQTVRPAPAGPAYEATQVDTRPQVESQVPARVPDQLRDRRFDEALVVRVLVSSAGRAVDVRTLRGSRIDASLDAAALTAVKQWRFSPARRRGQAVDCWISVGVPFRSEGGGTDR